MQFTRRDFLYYSAAGVVSAYAPRSRADSLKSCPIGLCVELGVPPTFSLGVSSGDVTPDRAILWTYYDGLFLLKLVVWEVSADLGSLPVVFADVKRADGGFVHVDVTMLKPYTAYRYAFVEGDYEGVLVGRSLIGKFKTPPTADMAVPLKIGAVSCMKNRYEPVLLEHAGARTDLDLFLLLGDTSYNDGCKSIGEFRERWASNLRKKGYHDLRASTSVIATLDDHELFDNFDPETVPDAHLSVALKAFFEHTPLRPPSEGKGRRIWRSFRWGRTCEIFALDCRTERKPSTRNSAKSQYISQEQMTWLKKGLKKSDAHFKIIMNSVPIANFPFFYESDRWEGYPTQREEILSFIDDAEIPGVLWLSGDFHFASVSRVSSKGPGSSQIEVLAGPGAQIPNYLALGLNAHHQWDWASTRNNYVTLSLDPENWEIKLVYQGGDEDPEKTELGAIEEIYQKVLKFGASATPRLARFEL